MQWSMDRNGGFSRADPAKLVLPPIMDPLYGFQAVNAEAQARDPHSLLSWTRRMLGVRRRYKAFGRGTLRFLYPGNRKILAYLREYDDERVLCVANMSRSLQAVELDLAAFDGHVPVEIMGGTPFPPLGQLPYLLTLPPYGFYAFQLCPHAQMPPWHQAPAVSMPDYETLVLRGALAEGPVMAHHRGVLERDVLPAWLPRRRWFGAKDRGIAQTRILYSAPWPDRGDDLVIAEVEVTLKDGGVERYSLPLGIAWEDETPPARAHQFALARARRGRRVGYLTDGFVLDAFASGLLRGLRQQPVLSLPDGDAIRFERGPAFDTADFPHDEDNRWVATEQSNSSMIVRERGVFKLFRHLQTGINPEVEMARHLTAIGYAHSPPLLGEVRRVSADGTVATLGVLQAFVRNQGDAWHWTLDFLLRSYDEFSHADHEENGGETLAEYDVLAAAIGTRLGQLHAALSIPSEDAAFDPQAATTDDGAAWASAIRAQMDRAMDALRQVDGNDDALLADRDALLALRGSLNERIDLLARYADGSLRTRIHGDFHLGQVLVVQGDAWLIDFEGEPTRSMAQRREKASPLRDVAGFLRSLDYVAAVTQRGDDGPALVADAGFAAYLERFRERASGIFLGAYLAVLDAADVPWVAARSLPSLVELFLLDKAAYEINYEAANRPAWLAVPLRGLLRLARQVPAKATEGYA
jgi:maltose alpha-D-glucosyltransferase/alpha-amylase